MIAPADVVVERRARLGEGPVWDERSGRLLFVDILAGEVHRHDPRSGALETFAVGEEVGAAVPRERGGLVLAVRSGFATLDLASGAVTPLRRVDEPLAGSRMNDGKCDAAGRFFAGTQSDEPGACGSALYRLDPDGSVTRVLGGVGISNGLDWSLDGRTLYYVDTATGGIDAFAFDPDTGSLGARRRLVDIPPEEGAPDGIALDDDGGVWVALFGGSAVHRYDRRGCLDAVLELPVSLVTSCAFGGPDLGDLYVTSARHRLVEPEPHAGCVFRLRPGVRGRPCRRFAG